MHQPMVESTFRRGSFGTEARPRTALPTSDAAQQFQDVLNYSERPVPSRRSSLRAVPTAYNPPPPPPPPPASVMETMRMASQSASMRSPSPSPPPVVDRSTGINSRKIHQSPVRSPASPSSTPRRNSSQPEHFIGSSSSPSPSASKRTYSFTREQARVPTVSAGPINPPARTNSCPPDADMMFQTRGTRSNSDGYNSVSKYVAEFSGRLTSSNSSQPSDTEEGHRPPYVRAKAPENTPSFDLAAQLEMESRRLELIWQETEKQWKDKHGFTLLRSQDTAFRRKIEGGVGIKDESPIDKEWRDMWKNTNESWSDEARRRKEDAHKRTASRNEESHFHTAHSNSRNAAITNDGKGLNAIFNHFEMEMEKRRQRAERKRLEEVEQQERKRCEEESNVLRAGVERESKSCRSSGSFSVVCEPRPAYRRSRSSSVAKIVDSITDDVGVSLVPPPPLGPPPVQHARDRRRGSSRGSTGSFEGLGQEEDPVRAQINRQRNEETRKNYTNAARQLYTSAPDLPRQRSQTERPIHPRDSFEDFGRDAPRIRSHQLGPSNEPHSSRPSLHPSISTRDMPHSSRQDSSFSIAEEILRLERERAELARRIQELRAAAEGALKPTALTPVSVVPERERGRRKSEAFRVKDGEKSRAESQATRKHSTEGAISKAMQDQSRKTEQQAPTYFNLKSEPATVTLERRPTTAAFPPGEASSGGVHFRSDKPSAEDLPFPTSPRVRTPGPTKIQTSARVRTPSSGSNSPAHSTDALSAHNATREAPIIGEPMPLVHEAVPPSSPPKVDTAPSQAALRPSGGSCDTELNKRPKSGSIPMLNVPHVNTPTSPIDSAYEQGTSHMGAKPPRATTFDPDRTPRVYTGAFPETNDEPGSPSMAPRVYINPNRARARAEVAPMGTLVRTEGSSRRRMDAAVGANVAAAEVKILEHANGEKRKKETELGARGEGRVTEEQLAREQRRAEEGRRLLEEQRAEVAQRHDAAERRECEERARYEQQRQDNADWKRRWESDPAYERAARAQQSTREPSALDAWNSYELRWSALSATPSDQPIGFRDIPWPLLRSPSGPESITPQAVDAFILSPLHSKDKPRKERLRNAMLRWHPDKFEGRWMSRVDENEQLTVGEGVQRVYMNLVRSMSGVDPSDSTVRSVIIPAPPETEEVRITIGKHMSARDIVEHLINWGCQDLTKKLDMNTFSEHPTSHGGFGDVYQGGLLAGGHVAVKVLRISTENYDNPKHLKRAARELYTWGKCRHPNVLELLGLAKFRGRIGMVSPWVNQGTLPHYLENNEEVDRCNLCAQISDGLSYLHEAGIVHGNLKGANILTLADGTPVLNGFGNAMFLSQGLQFTETTREGSLTARWAAPELFGLFDSDCKPSKEADVYALGMVMSLQDWNDQNIYLIAFLRDHFTDYAIPFKGKSDFIVLKLVSKKKHPERPNDRIPVESRDGNKFWRLLRKSWAYDPEKRPRAAAVATAMRSITPHGLKAIAVSGEQTLKINEALPPREPISRQMIVSEVISHLAVHGCHDLTDTIDRDTLSEYAISQGGFSDVHSARLGTKQVAVKILRISISSLAERPKHLKHTARELHTWSKCKHPNVLPLLGFGVFRGGIGMISPWMGKGTLPRYLERKPDVDRCNLCTQICVGLSYLHEIGIIHGDLKGTNILISDDGIPVITDFGSSVHIDQSMRFTQTTSDKSLTLHWSASKAPELFAGSGVHTKSADVYALGMTIYEVMAGTIPYAGKNHNQVLMLLAFNWEAPGRPKGIPAGHKNGDRFWDLLVSCWSLKPEGRPSASEVATIIETIDPDGLGPDV